MKKILSYFIVSIFVVASCSKKKEEPKSAEFNQGELVVLADDSFKSVVEGLAQAYMINYPSTKVEVKVQKEDLAFMDMLNNHAKMIAISKPLNQEEIQEYEKATNTKFHQDFFAIDAVLFVVSKNSTRTSLSIEDIKKELLSGEKNLIFDGNNSSNLNFVANKIGKKPSELKYATIVGNDEVVKELDRYPNKIGVISLNTISRPYANEATKLREMINVLPIEEKGKVISYEGEGLTKMKYPFVRTIYFLTNENGFGIAKGFLRFSCTQLGQIVVSKEGLQPYFLFNREVQMR